MSFLPKPSAAETSNPITVGSMDVAANPRQRQHLASALRTAHRGDGAQEEKLGHTVEQDVRRVRALSDGVAGRD